MIRELGIREGADPPPPPADPGPRPSLGARPPPR